MGLGRVAHRGNEKREAKGNAEQRARLVGVRVRVRVRVGVGVGVGGRSRSRARSRARARVRIRITAPACFSRVTSGASPSGLESSNASEPG